MRLLFYPSRCVDAAAVKAAVEKTIATFGQLDVLVKNAGTAIPKPFEKHACRIQKILR